MAADTLVCDHPAPTVARGLCRSCYNRWYAGEQKAGRKPPKKPHSGSRMPKEYNTPKRRAWAEANPVRARTARLRRQGHDVELTEDEWAEILDWFQHVCAYCGRGDLPLHIEHKTPVPRGGLTSKDNCVPSCKPCNSTKGTRTVQEFLNG
jgi:5-methylcytosine-specific restriction endonuclease McrA